MYGRRGSMYINILLYDFLLPLLSVSALALRIFRHLSPATTGSIKMYWSNNLLLLYIDLFRNISLGWYIMLVFGAILNAKLNWDWNCRNNCTYTFAHGSLALLRAYQAGRYQNIQIVLSNANAGVSNTLFLHLVEYPACPWLRQNLIKHTELSNGFNWWAWWHSQLWRHYHDRFCWCNTWY